jgi:hypothetical protein
MSQQPSQRTLHKNTSATPKTNGNRATTFSALPQPFQESGQKCHIKYHTNQNTNSCHTIVTNFTTTSTTNNTTNVTTTIAQIFAPTLTTPLQ